VRDPQHLQGVALDEVANLTPPDDEAAHLTGYELLEAQTDARPLRQASYSRVVHRRRVGSVRS
jgi:hypothetical protein